MASRRERRKALKVLKIECDNNCRTDLNEEPELQSCPVLRPFLAPYAYLLGEDVSHDRACELAGFQMDHKFMNQWFGRTKANLNKRTKPKGYWLMRVGRGFNKLVGIDRVVFIGRPPFADHLKPGKNVTIIDTGLALERGSEEPPEAPASDA